MIRPAQKHFRIPVGYDGGVRVRLWADAARTVPVASSSGVSKYVPPDARTENEFV